MAVMALALLLTALSSSEPLKVVSNLDPQRYAGEWFEIARLPHRLGALAMSPRATAQG
jgi:lipocalin